LSIPTCTEKHCKRPLTNIKHVDVLDFLELHYGKNGINEIARGFYLANPNEQWAYNYKEK